MLIDWFTVGAQALNFIILLWLMKRFLLKPILNAIDAREQRIATELADADAKQVEAQKEHDEYRHKNEAFEQKRSALLLQATDEVRVERQRLLKEARGAADAMNSKRQETQKNDARSLEQSIRLRTQKEVFAIARKVLVDLATASLEERLSDVFIRRLRALDNQAKAGLLEALRTASAPACVRSAFELPAEQRAAIQHALNEAFAADIRIRFESAPDLVSGIEFTVNGQKLAWSIADYIASLEIGVRELMVEQDKPASKSEAKPRDPSESTPDTAAVPSRKEVQAETASL